MSELGGLESYTPGEGTGGASEALSDEARQRFAQAEQQIKQIMREEKKAKKRDDRVAATIRQFLGDERYAHLFQLISRLAAMDCPSVFILAILSLIHEGSLQAVEEYIAENRVIIETPNLKEVLQNTDKLPPDMQEKLIHWTVRLELVMNIDAVKILSRLMPDEGNIDGAVLQITTFVLVDFFLEHGRVVTYEDMQPLTVKILQDILEPHVETMEKYFAAKHAEKDNEDAS